MTADPEWPEVVEKYKAVERRRLSKSAAFKELFDDEVQQYLDTFYVEPDEPKD